MQHPNFYFWLLSDGVIIFGARSSILARRRSRARFLYRFFFFLLFFLVRLNFLSSELLNSQKRKLVI
jgi:hypothetical protein